MRGRITLLGVVDSVGGKNIAGIEAHEMPSTFGVETDLVVESTKTTTSR